MLNQGAEATVTPCTFLNVPCLSKRRLPKTYRNHALDAKLRRSRTKLEAKAMHRAKTSGTSCPLVLNVDLQKCEIIQTKLPGVSLTEFIRTASDKNTEIVLRAAGVQLAKLHSAGLSHGDSTTSNFIAHGKKVFIFDFGLSSFDPSLEEQATDLLLFSKSVSPAQFKNFLTGYTGERGLETTKALLALVTEIQLRARYVERYSKSQK